MPPPPGSCAIDPPKTTRQAKSHLEEPLISLKSEDSLGFEDLRRNLSAMTDSVETAGASADWMKMWKEEEVDELLMAGVATGFAAAVSSEEDPVNRDTPPFDPSSVKPESPSRLDHNLDAFKSSTLSTRSVEDGEPVNNMQEVKIESDTVSTVVYENFETLRSQSSI